MKIHRYITISPALWAHLGKPSDLTEGDEAEVTATVTWYGYRSNNFSPDEGDAEIECVELEHNDEVHDVTKFVDIELEWHEIDEARRDAADSYGDYQYECWKERQQLGE